MNEIIEVSSDWLALREPEDARARSRELALAASSRLGPGPIEVHDLGSGTGSMMRWLAPLLPGPQAWVLHDWNPELVARATSGDVPLDRDGRPVSVTARTGELERLDARDLEGASLATASALLDVLTFEELRAVVGAIVAVGCPALMSLSVTGDVRLDPPDARDDGVAGAFNAHQERLVGARRLLGPSGAGLAQLLFRQAGWNVRTADTHWRLGRHEPALLEQWFDGWLEAALEQRPELRDECAAYRALRAEQLQRGALSVVVAHADLLAWP